MANLVLKATRRDVTGPNAKVLRRQGQLPAVMYGHNFEPVSILLDAHTANLRLAGLSASAVITIELDGQPLATLIREKQKDYLRNRLLHVDFQVVSLTEKIRTAVNIDLVGVAPAVKDFNAVIVNNVTTVSVEALPGDLPQSIKVDLSSLANIGDAIHVRDLNVDSSVEILSDPDEIIVVATGAAAEEEPEVIEVEEPEVIERGKKEEDEE
jgi:large subunit ribosomal protein L25